MSQNNFQGYRPSRNPYWNKIKNLDSGAWTDQDTEGFAGQWHQRFIQAQDSPARARGIHLEIGCNGGHVLLGLAQAQPEDSFIGLDWKFKQVYLAHQKAKKRDIGNVIFLRAHAERVDQIFGLEELKSVRIFFPDPWQKKSQKKHRYLTTHWFQKLLPLLLPEGKIEIRTDHLEYFRFICAEIQNCPGLEAISLTEDCYANHPDPMSLEIPEVSLFEKIFIRDQIPIKRGLFVKEKVQSLGKGSTH